MDTDQKILFILGQVQADLANVKDDVKEMTVKVDSCVESTTRQEQALGLIIPEVNDYTKMKNRGIGIFATVGVFGTILGTYFIESIKEFFKRL